MGIEVQPVTPRFVARVTGLDLAETGDPAIVTAIEAAIAQYGVLVFPGQTLTDETHMDFSRQFGPLETAATAKAIVADARQRLKYAEVGDVSNLDADNKTRGRHDRKRLHELGNRLWHTDSSFKATPAKYSLLYAYAVPPEGGETEFADLKTAYDTLPENTKREIDDLVAEHYLMHSRGTIGFTEYSDEERSVYPPVPQRVVRYLSDSGRKALYLASHASHIVGWPIPEGRVLLRELIDHATQRPLVYTHHWKVGDLVMWDNRCTMHRARPFDESYHRDLRRTTVEDVAPSVAQPFVPYEAAARVA